MAGAVLLSITGCGGGGGSSGGTLTTGVYAVSDFTMTADDCRSYDDDYTLEGSSFDVVVDDEAISLMGLEGTVTRNRVDAETEQQSDFTGFGYDCVLTVRTAFEGTIPGDDRVDARRLHTLEVAEGEACAQALDELYDLEISIPCETELLFDLDRTGDIPPPPPPPPSTPDYCRVMWISTAMSPGLENWYVLDVPVSSWTTGTVDYNLSANWGIFAYGYDPELDDWIAAGMASGGEFTLAVDGVDPGSGVVFTDTEPQIYSNYDDFELTNATDGRGTFTGVVSDLSEGAEPTPGTGTVTILYAGSNLTFGTKESYSYCYE